MSWGLLLVCLCVKVSCKAMHRQTDCGRVIALLIHGKRSHCSGNVPSFSGWHRLMSY